MLKYKEQLYKCPECGLRYRDEGTKEECRKWCEEHHSCNLEIIQKAVQEEEDSSEARSG